MILSKGITVEKSFNPEGEHNGFILRDERQAHFKKFYHSDKIQPLLKWAEDFTS